MPKVGGNRPHRDEQRLRDLAVCQALRCELSDSELAGGERLDAADALAPRLGPGGDQLLARAPGNRQGATAGGKVERATKRLTRIAPAAGAAQRGSLFG